MNIIDIGKMVSDNQQKFKQILDLAESKKNVDKKKCIPQLLQFLEDPEALKELDENSIEKKCLPTWDQLINAVHNFLVSETERTIEKNKDAHSNVSKMLPVFLNIMYHSHKRARMLVAPKDIASYVIQVLGNRSYQVLHESYMNVLTNHVLTHKYYHARIMHEQWEELWEICISAYRKGTEDPQKTIELIHKIVKYGCVHSQLHFRVSTVLPTLEDIFVRVKSEDKYPSVFALLNLMIEHIGKDRRTMLCDFTERVLARFDSFVFHDTESYKFLSFALAIHHPTGVLQGSDSAYASDWEKWNEILRTLHVSILNDLSNPTEGFADVACEVFRQVLGSSKDPWNVSTSTLLDTDSSTVTKRRRTTQGRPRLADLISENNYDSCWNVLRIMIRSIDEHPTSLDTDRELVSFLNEVTMLFMKNNPNYELIAKLNRVLAKLESNLDKEKDTDIIEALDIYWKRVIELAFRSLNLESRHQPSRSVLQSLVDLKKFTKFNELLESYTKDKVPWSTSNASMLLSLCEGKFLFNDSTRDDLEKEKRRLLKWTLKVFDPNQDLEDLPVSSMSRLMVGLILKPWHAKFEENHVDRNKFGTNEDRKAVIARTELLQFLGETEECHLALNYDSSLLLDRADETESDSNETENFVEILYDEQLKNDFVGFLESVLENLVARKSLEASIAFATIVGKIATDLSKLSVIVLDEESKLLDLIKMAMVSISQSTKEIDFENCDSFSTWNSRLKFLLLLYETSYAPEVSEIVVSMTPPGMISRLFGFMENLGAKERAIDSLPGPSEPAPISTSTSTSRPTNLPDLPRTESPEPELVPGPSSTQLLRPSLTKTLSSFPYRRDFQRIPFEESTRPEDAAKILIGKILSAFYSKSVGKGMLEIQKRTFRKLLCVKNFVFSTQVDHEMTIQIFNATFANSARDHYPPEAVAHLEEFLSTFFESTQSSEDVARYILKNMPKVLDLSWNSKKDLGKLLDVVLRIRRKLKVAEYGPQVCLGYIDFLLELETSPNSKIQIPAPLELDDSQPIVNDIPNFLDSPFHCVRWSTLKCLKLLFARKGEDQWKRAYFEHLKTTSLRMVANFEEPEGDQRLARVSSAVHAFALVARFYRVLRKNAVLALLKVAVTLKVGEKSIRKVLTRIDEDENPVTENLSYLIRYWFTGNSALEDFPWYLTGCESERAFFENYHEMIVPVFVEVQKLNDLGTTCENFGSSFGDLLEKCFAEVYSWLICSVQLDTAEDECSYAKVTLRNLENNENDFATLKPFPALLEQHLARVVLFLVRRSDDGSDPRHLDSTAKASIPDSDLPDFGKVVVLEAFRRLSTSLGTPLGTSLANHLCKDRPDIPQKVLLDLVCDIYRYRFIGDKVKAFHRYVFFCEYLARELEVNGDSLAASAYVVRDVTRTLLHFVKEDTRILSELACGYLRIFLERMLPARAEDIQGTLSYALKVLAPEGERRPGKVPASETLGILRLLILEHGRAMRGVVKGLGDDFPKDPSFDDLREFCYGLKTVPEPAAGQRRPSLESEILFFLDAIDELNVRCNVKGIVRLRKELALLERHRELAEMYDKLHELRGSEEDCAASLLHRLIFVLLKLSDDEDVDVSLEASKCLAELGPASLTTTILRPQRNKVKERVPAEDALTCKVILHLTDLLVDPDVKVRRSASDCLHGLSDSPWGEKLLDLEYMETVLMALEEDPEPGPKTNRLRYLCPFVARPVGGGGRKRAKKKKPVIQVDWATFEACVNPESQGLWTALSKDAHSDSIRKLTVALTGCFGNFYLKDLVPLLTSDQKFCELALPRILYLLFDIDSGRASGPICRCLNEFFQRHFVGSNREQVQEDSASNASFFEEERAKTEAETELEIQTLRDNQATARFMINLVNFLRIQSASDRWPFDYIFVAKAAQYCTAYLTSIFYCDLYINLAWEGRPRSSRDDHSMRIDYLYKIDRPRGKELQDIVREAYTKIGDLDAARGCGSSHLDDPKALKRFYMDTNQCLELLVQQDLDMYHQRSSMREMVDVLRFCRLDHTLNQYKSWVPDDMDLDQLFDSAWRLSDWTLLDNMDDEDLPPDAKFIYHHYKALKTLHRRLNDRAFEDISNARRNVIGELRNVSLEGTAIIYGKMSQLQMLRELEEMASAQPEAYARVLSKWAARDTINSNEYSYVEPILSQRAIACQEKDTAFSSGVLRSAITDTYLTMARVTSRRGYHQRAFKAIAAISTKDALLEEVKYKVLFEEAHLEWDKGRPDLAKIILRRMMARMVATGVDRSLWSESLLVYGTWVAHTKSENPKDIIRKYFEKSIEVHDSIEEKSGGDLKNLHAAYVALARHGDLHYQQVVEYMRSSQYEGLVETIKYAHELELRKEPAAAARKNRAIPAKEEPSIYDSGELSYVAQNREYYLVLAFTYYHKVLYVSDDHDSVVCRLVSLLLENKEHAKLNRLLTEDSTRLPSHKFVFLVPQLVPHMSNDADLFTDTVHGILKRCAMDHPHHTLPVLMALENLYADYKFNKESLPRKKQDQRIAGAKKVLSELSRSSIGDIVKDSYRLSNALIMFANLEVDGTKVSTFRIPSKQEILKLKGLEDVMVPTIALDVRPQGAYGRVVGVHKYENSYETVGGVNTPKKIFCIGTDGICRKQLLKGKDDLRQDAVMQQVFSVMNGLLKDSLESRKRKLNVRTYKVVPLTERCGILEWCENTAPIAKVLADEKDGLHVRYFPKDPTALACRQKMRNIGKITYDEKLRVYREICEAFHPAFHYFFTEKYPSPDAWFQRRLSYTRSVATNSIVGYVLGLGDRHLSNILIDQTTAEVVHIDFGVAFEQGKCLPIPELIPFRLTRDLEVAMGVSGFEGTMKRCCEETMQVLRNKRLTIKTLLQVLLYDPLYSWTITPAKACRIRGRIRKELNIVIPEQEEDPEELNKSAERALTRLDQKLQGVEDGFVTTIAGQVEQLIHQARDPVNLSRMYEGWQPYL